MASHMERSVEGKRILVLGGSPQETIDGAYYFANNKRDHSHGIRVSEVLASLGAAVTLVNAHSSMQLPTDARGIETIDDRTIISTADLAAACRPHQLKQFDCIVQLANIPSFIRAQQSDQKLRVKSEAEEVVPLEAEGNISFIMRLRWMFPHSAVFGYDNQQRWFAIGDDALAKRVFEITESCIEHALPRQSPMIDPAGGEVQTLAGKKVVIASVPTAEPITVYGDVIANCTPVLPGNAIAEALAAMGAEVVFVSRHKRLHAPVHGNIRTIDVNSAGEMYQAVTSELAADVFVSVAAVADFTLEHPLELPPKEGQVHTLELCQTPDILHAVGTNTSLRPSVLVGFTANTHDILEHARNELNRRGADLICAYEIGPSVTASSSSENSIIAVTPASHEALSGMSELEVGKMIGWKIDQLLRQTTSA